MGSAPKELMLRKASGTTHAPLAPTAGQEPRLVTIPLGLLDPDPDQTRKDLGNLQELESSIGTHGLLQPIIVEPVEGGRYRILAGERRFTACRNLQWKTVPCIVRTVAEQSRLELRLMENVQRQDLHPVEVAQAYRRLMSEFNLTQRDLAQRMGKSVANVNQALRLLDLAPDVLADVQTSEHASKSALLELAKMPEPEAQRELWEQMKEGKVTARQARSAKDQAKGGPSRQTTVTIALPDAMISVRFMNGKATDERLKSVLEQALAMRGRKPARARTFARGLPHRRVDNTCFATGTNPPCTEGGCGMLIGDSACPGAGRPRFLSHALFGRRPSPFTRAADRTAAAPRRRWSL